MSTILKGARIANTMGRWRKSGPDNFYLANRPKSRKKKKFNKRKKHNKRRRKKPHTEGRNVFVDSDIFYSIILTLGNRSSINIIICMWTFFDN